MVEKIQLMGIVNLTGDSFYSGSRMLAEDGSVDISRLLSRAGTMLAEGADIIDLGACSTRPGSVPVGAEEEWRRLCPALRALREAFPAMRISVDTYWSSVVERVFDTIGPFLVNDISAGMADPAMLPTVGRLGLPYVAMHSRGTPETMASLTDYDDVVADVKAFFRAFALRASEAGITDWILDPGFGFAKTLEQNWELLHRLHELQELGRPILVGISRKSMIYKKFNLTPETALEATRQAHLIAVEQGASILRVHDVAGALPGYSTV